MSLLCMQRNQLGDGEVGPSMQMTLTFSSRMKESSNVALNFPDSVVRLWGS